MINPSDSYVRAVRAEYADVTARLDREMDRIQSEHDRKKAEFEARDKERERRDAEFLAKREAEQKTQRDDPLTRPPAHNPWPTARRRAPEPQGDGTETGYYSARSWLE